MYEVKIKLNTIEDVKELVNIVTEFNCDFEIVAGRYIVDAKSIMGIFSLDLSKSLTLVIRSDDDGMLAGVKAKIEKFIVK